MRQLKERSMNMGQSLVIKGELSGGEDLTLEGRLEGKISLPDHVLTVGASANIDAEIHAKIVIILGHVKGDVTAREKFELRAGGSVEGTLVAPKVAMAEGATFNGQIEMPKIVATNASSRSAA
jgi:cytoskeletal protein CcmA (bactofilin family)